MVFPSVQFALFFPVVFALSWLLMPNQRSWKPYILLASYVFYASTNPRFCLLLGAVTLGNQLGAVLIDRTEPERTRRRKAIMWATVALDLGVLGVFKYYGFFAQSMEDTLGSVGLSPGLPLLSIALPVGVSFFTFQAISYVVDVWRGLIRPAKMLDAAIYLSFFPHLVAGPIVRAREFLPQLATPRTARHVRLGPAVTLIAFGLVKKIAIADTLARLVIDPVFGVPQAYSAPDVLLASYAYTVQIYCDFSGYTDIAIGLALLLGFQFPQNFDKPYRSLSFQEFWRRWHMTLSRFLRDFVYIPLGGNRGGKILTYRNLMLTMLIGGLWHGAAWTFVIWGGLHGGYLAAERLLSGRVKAPPKWLQWFIVFHLVTFAWILFRSPDLALAGEFLSRFAVWGPPTLWSSTAVALVVGVLAVQLAPTGLAERVRLWLDNLNPAALGTGLAVIIILVAATVPSQGVPPFIYFRF